MAKRRELDDREIARQPKNTPSTSDPPLQGGLQLNLGHLLGTQTRFISKLVSSAKNARLFNKGCYGSQQGLLSAVDSVLLEELQVSISYLSRMNQVTFYNDVTSCYDRIIIVLANLVARQFGMPEEIARLHGSTLESMWYYVSMALGILDTSYSHTKESPVYV
jgi:hypothetical protein